MWCCSKKVKPKRKLLRLVLNPGFVLFLHKMKENLIFFHVGIFGGGRILFSSHEERLILKMQIIAEYDDKLSLFCHLLFCNISANFLEMREQNSVTS